jgi:hypothetical protein
MKIDLGSVVNFAVLASSTVTNTGSTVISGSPVVRGDIGVSPGTAITGFPPGLVSPPGEQHGHNAYTAQAQVDLTAAYNDLAARQPTADLTGQNLGGLTLMPGVYNFSSSAQLTGELTLNAEGNSSALFIFNIGSTLTTASASAIILANNAQSCNVFWRVGSSATIGTTTAFCGSILALASITATTGASINGRLLACNGAVTLDSNRIIVN